MRDGAEQIVLGQYIEAAVTQADEDRGALARDAAHDLLNGGRGRDHGKRLAHDFANDDFLQVFAFERDRQELVFINGADGRAGFENRQLGEII